jgi:hypothetical protein
MKLLLVCLLAGMIAYAWAAMSASLPEKSVKATSAKLNQKCLLILRDTNATLTSRCEFFKCFEERFPCGPKYWILNWGYKYCLRYADSKFIAKFTPKGKKMLESINKCLPPQFEKFYNQTNIRCKRLWHDAFKAQTACYTSIQETFCHAFEENKLHFVKALDYNDLMSSDSTQMIKKATQNCTPKIDLYSIV